MHVDPRWIVEPEAGESELFEAYRNTTYVAETPAGELRLRPGEPNSELERLDLPGRSSDEWAFITAWNPKSEQLDDAENAERQRGLEKRLRRSAHDVFPGEGRANSGDWPPEASLLAVGIQLERAVELAGKYGQNAILAGRAGEAPRLVDCRGGRTQMLDLIDAEDDVGRLMNALVARGFLMARSREHVWLSDNAHGNDEDDLNDFLRRERLFCLARELGRDPTRTDVIRGILSRKDPDELDDALVSLMMHLPRWTEETWWSTDETTWEWFVARRHGRKVSAHRLDAEVAFLVKAMNAAGIATSMSCAGGHRKHQWDLPQNVRIWFMSHYFYTWATFVLERLESTPRGWSGGSNFMLEPYELPYRHLMPLAAELYRRRIPLRELRRAAALKADEELSEGADEEERCETFLEAARALAPEFNL